MQYDTQLPQICTCLPIYFFVESHQQWNEVMWFMTLFILQFLLFIKTVLSFSNLSHNFRCGNAATFYVCLTSNRNQFPNRNSQVVSIYLQALLCQILSHKPDKTWLLASICIFLHQFAFAFHWLCVAVCGLKFASLCLNLIKSHQIFHPLSSKKNKGLTVRNVLLFCKINQKWQNKQVSCHGVLEFANTDCNKVVHFVFCYLKSQSQFLPLSSFSMHLAILHFVAICSP